MTTLEVPVYGLDRTEMELARAMLASLRGQFEAAERLLLMTNHQLGQIRAPKMLDVDGYIAAAIHDIDNADSDIREALGEAK